MTFRLLAPVSAGQRDGLTDALLRAGELMFYRDRFAEAGMTAPVVRGDPVAALARLPLFDVGRFDRLAVEALALRRHDLGGVELTSGTTSGVPKRRVLSEEDVTLDAALLTRLLRIAGVRAEDRVAAAELTVTPLAVAFLEACERLGVRESAALALTPATDADVLRRLDPTVLITTPSVLMRLAPLLAGPAWAASLRLAVYNGDRLPRSTAAALRGWGAGVRSLYGLTETSALGLSCEVEEDVHLSPEHALFEVCDEGDEGELVVTTLGFSMPLLRYPTGDRVRVLRGHCPCGLRWPRVEILGRTGGRFALFDAEFTVDEFRMLVPRHPDDPLQIMLSDGDRGRERITFRLAAAAMPERRAVLKRLRSHPSLGYFVEARLVQIRFARLEQGDGRKLPPLVDTRQREGGG